MELTLDQALQKGIEAHKAGKVQEADRYYTAILKANPKHCDANHNMGVLAVGVGKVEQALPFFKTAIEVNASIAQYWLSYIDALIKLGRIADAKAVLEQAKSKGAKGDEFEKLEKQLAGRGDDQEPPQKQVQPLINLYTQGQYQQVLNQASQLQKRFPNSINLYRIIGATNKGLGRLDEAIEAYNKAISIKPDYAEAYYNMGISLQEQGKLDEAIEAYNKALSLKPDYAEACNNMGTALQKQGKLDEAIEAYSKAVSIKVDFSEVYHNMGNALQEQGKLDEAIETYTKALAINPDYADAYYNMGVALQEQDKLDDAIKAYNKAISINPDYTEAYYNMGSALKEQGKLDEAIEAYNRGLSINPDYTDAYYNIGAALQEQGKLDEAIKAYKKALSIKHDYAEVWNNLYFPLQAIKSKINSDHDLNALYSKGINSNSGKIEISILDLRLHRRQENEGIYLEKAISSIANAKNTTIPNPKFDKNTQEKIQEPPDKIIALVHFGRSGTGLMHSLIDGHREVSTLPSIYFSEYFDHANWVRIISDGWDGMIDRFMSIYDVLFDASSPVPVESKSKKLIKNIGIKEGMANVGDQKNEVLKVDKNIFKKELMRLMAYYNDLDAFLFFKLVHSAYNAAINDNNSKNFIFYHIHNPDVYAQLNFIRSAPETKWVMMVREPIQSLESWMRLDFSEKEYFRLVSRLLTMLFEIDNSIYSSKNTIGIRLEDLKERPHKTIPALCKWMGITEEESLYKMTAQGKKWWGDPTSPDYSKDGMDPFGKTSIKRKVGSIFSEKDQFILRTLFYPFSVCFGYTEENEKQFKVDLQKIRSMIDEMFDFEKAVTAKTEADPELFMRSGSYLYLRSGLIERWNTLSKFGTYPNMIKLIEI